VSTLDFWYQVPSSDLLRFRVCDAAIKAYHEEIAAEEKK
jgi:hypothetical protein